MITECPKITPSKRLQAVYNDIWHDLEDLGREEVKRYKSAFPTAPDYNLVHHGCMRVYYCEIRDLYASAGYENVKETYKHAYGDMHKGDYKVSNGKLWDMYRHAVGRVAREYVKEA